VAVGEPPDGVLMGEPECIGEQRELIVLSSQALHDVPRRAIDLGDFIKVTAGEQNVSVAFQFDCVCMDGIDL
jgi:hypothetical protein